MRSSSSSSPSPPSPLLSVLAGGLAGGVSRLVIAPLDVVKIRLQLQRRSPAPLYTGLLQTAARVVREEGGRGLWSGNSAAMGLWVSYSALQFPVYSALHRGLEEAAAGGGGGGALLPTQLLAGGAAALVATVLTYPLDWARTRLAGQGVQRVYMGTLHALAAAARSPAGPTAVFQGLLPTLAQVVPNAAVTVGEGGGREGRRCRTNTTALWLYSLAHPPAPSLSSSLPTTTASARWARSQLPWASQTALRPHP